jgi:hypothetical protein
MFLFTLLNTIGIIIWFFILTRVNQHLLFFNRIYFNLINGGFIFLILIEFLILIFYLILKYYEQNF